MLKAAIEGDKEKVKQLLKGVSPNYQGSAYGFALLYASGNGHLEIVKLLIEDGANVNLQNGFDSTALHAAASRGYDEIVLLLLEKGANVSLKDATGENAHQMAVRHGKLTTAALIAKYCPDRKCD